MVQNNGLIMGGENTKSLKLCPPLFHQAKVKMLDYNDSFFDYFKHNYEDFEQWYFKDSTQNRDCWVHYNNNKIGALLIYKIEQEPIECISIDLPEKTRLKICTLKVDETILGNKLGELLLKYSVKLAVNLNIDEIYLTHFTEDGDKLIKLIQEYGFDFTCKKDNNEDIFLKKLFPDSNIVKSLMPLEIAKKYYPSFYDGNDVNKFIVPIYPKFHDRLFTDIIDGNKRQTMLSEFHSDFIPENESKFIIEGNAIQKVYLSHSNNRKMNAGDVLLFYKTSPSQCLTTIGIVEQVVFDITDPSYILDNYKRRTVYKDEEIINFVEKPTSLILFLHVDHFRIYPDLDSLLKLGLRAPQSINEISSDIYENIKELGHINTRFTLSEC